MASGIFTQRNINQLRTLGGLSGAATPFVEYLVVAGGGGSGGQLGAGGGAGGLLQGITTVKTGISIPITVGGGGVAPNAVSPGLNGANSCFGNIWTLGGGGGGTWASGSGADGGSGGGGNQPNGPPCFGGQGVPGQGNSGGTITGNYSTTVSAAGGGGAGNPGIGIVTAGTTSYGHSGGDGIGSSILGQTYTWAGGGGGFSYGGGTQYGGPGGKGGGGGGGFSVSGTGGTGGTGYNSGGTPSAQFNGGNGGTNSGGGGGGASITGGGSGGTGGSGIVIISYPDTYANAVSQTNATYSTSGSGSIAGTTATHFSYAGQSAFVLGTGDFTIECWVYFNNFTTYPTVVDFRDSSNAGNGISIYAYNTGVLTLYANGADRISGATLSTGQWYHIAVTRSGTSTKMFLDGTQTGSTYSDSTNYTCGGASPVFMANGAKSSGAINGSVSNVRIVKGTALYTTTFTPSTTPLTTVSGTSLLLNSVSGAFLADGSSNGFAASVSVQLPTWSSLSPFSVTGYKNRVYRWTSSGTITF